MNVAIVSIGTELLLSDILNTNAAQVTRRLRENELDIAFRVTVGDEPAAITALVAQAMSQADAVITLGGLGNEERDYTRQAIAAVTGYRLPEELASAGGRARRLGEAASPVSGYLIEAEESTLICLPGNPREMAYLLETEALPYLRRRVRVEGATAWALLRTAGVMESSLAQELADLVGQGKRQNMTLASFAGQTDIRLTVEDDTPELAEAALERLAQVVEERLGDQVYGRRGDMLETVVASQLRAAGLRLAVAECHIGGALERTLGREAGVAEQVTFWPDDTHQELAASLGLPTLNGEPDLTRWCRTAAEQLLRRGPADLGLLVYNHITPGGVQVLVTLASSRGVSVMQRSFSGHPDNIDHWANTLGLVHLRRWLLAHGPAPAEDAPETMAHS